MNVLQNIAENEQDRNNVHNQANFFRLAAHQFDEAVADAAECDSFWNAVSKRHHGNG